MATLLSGAPGLTPERLHEIYFPSASLSKRMKSMNGSVVVIEMTTRTADGMKVFYVGTLSLGETRGEASVVARQGTEKVNFLLADLHHIYLASSLRGSLRSDSKRLFRFFIREIDEESGDIHHVSLPAVWGFSVECAALLASPAHAELLLPTR